MRVKDVEILGMKLEEITHHDCVAHFAVGDTWASLFDIESKTKGKGYATGLLRWAKRRYEKCGKKVYGSVPLNSTMKHIYDKLGYDYHRIRRG